MIIEEWWSEYIEGERTTTTTEGREGKGGVFVSLSSRNDSFVRLRRRTFTTNHLFIGIRTILRSIDALRVPSSLWWKFISWQTNERSTLIEKSIWMMSLNDINVLNLLIFLDDLFDFWNANSSRKIADQLTNFQLRLELSGVSDHRNENNNFDTKQRKKKRMFSSLTRLIKSRSTRCNQRRNRHMALIHVLCCYYSNWIAHEEIKTMTKIKDFASHRTVLQRWEKIELISRQVSLRNLFRWKVLSSCSTHKVAACRFN